MDIFYLCVGGCIFATTRSTLGSQTSFFSSLVESTSDNYAFVDRDPTHFRFVLNWMRGVRHLPEDEASLQELLWEVDFYCLEGMKTAILEDKRRYSLLRSLHRIAEETRRI